MSKTELSGAEFSSTVDGDAGLSEGRCRTSGSGRDCLFVKVSDSCTWSSGRFQRMSAVRRGRELELAAIFSQSMPARE
jgi:hypothetical protein